MKRRGFFGALLGAAAAPVAAKIAAELPSEPLMKAFPAPRGSGGIEGANIYESSFSAYCGRLNGYVSGEYFRGNCEGCGAPL